ncbi:Probable metabolite transport protein CsbC [Gordonia bronchialis]|nr:Probable metabolite transport protein CsbC [Gordonia bronchialis]
MRSPECADAELAEVHALALEEKESQTGGWSDLATPWIRRLIIVGIGIGVFSQFSGINVIMYYGTHLLENAGFSSNGAIVANTLNGFFSVLGVTVGILLMNKFNRRSMIITGYVLTTTFHALVGIFALALPDNTVKPYVIMILVIGFVFSMQALIGPLTWLLLSEIFPLKIRSFAMGVCVFMLWIANSIVAFGFPPTVDALGISSTFFLFAALGLAAIIFMWRMAPETRGRTLEQFEDDFRVQHS